MENHLTNSISNDKLNIIKQGKYIKFKYQDDYYVNNYLNYLINNKKEIRFNKRGEFIYIRTNDSYVDKNYSDEMVSEMVSFLKVISVCNQFVGEIEYVGDGYRFLINRSIYSHIYDNYLLKSQDKYIFSEYYCDDLFKEINKYNKCVDIVSSIKYDNIFNNDFDKIKEYYNSNCKLVIYDNKIINLFIVGTDSVKFTFKNSNVFYNVVLPELIRLYIDNIDSIIKKEHIKQFNTSFVNINDNFYLLGLKEDIVVSSLKYIDDILNIKKYQIDLNKEFMVDYTEDEVNINYNKRVYSYGYANILLISFIISVITILLCFFKG